MMLNQSGNIIIKGIIAVAFFVMGVFTYPMLSELKNEKLGIDKFDYSESESGIGETHTMRVTGKGRVEWLAESNEVLDPEVFGTPEHPINIHKLPLQLRKSDEDGNLIRDPELAARWSQYKIFTEGDFIIEAQDIADYDGVDISDKAEFEANFKGPEGNDFKIVLDKLAYFETGPALGGVLTHEIVRRDGQLGPLTEEDQGVYDYLLLTFEADVYKNGELIADNVETHAGFTEFGPERESKRGEAVKLHVVVNPIATGYFSEEGNEQLYLHINFTENLRAYEFSGFNLTDNSTEN